MHRKITAYAGIALLISGIGFFRHNNDTMTAEAEKAHADSLLRAGVVLPLAPVSAAGPGAYTLNHTQSISEKTRIREVHGFYSLAWIWLPDQDFI